MKAFLLAAGLGTRLKPLTDDTPKCLVKINGVPLLAWWVRLFEVHSVTEVLINLHYLPERVREFLERYDTRIKFKYYYEENLLGSAGTLRENKDFVKGESDFLVCYADNLTNYNLTQFYNFHISKSALSSVALFETDHPHAKGIVEVDEHNKIISFEEKPKSPKSNLANAGIYIFQPAVLELIPNYELTDIGFHLLPKLVGNAYGWLSNDYLIDIGTPSDLKKASREFSITI